VKALESLAFWIAFIVMMLSFARLFRENDGASKDLFWWCFRLAIIFTLFGNSRAIINAASQIGYDIINVTEFRKVFWLFGNRRATRKFPGQPLFVFNALQPVVQGLGGISTAIPREPVFWDAELEFNAGYEKFTEGMFLVKSVKSPEEAIGALASENADFRDITKMLDVSSWNLSNVFIGVTIGRFLLEFA
jgi:hypothetical protein